MCMSENVSFTPEQVDHIIVGTVIQEVKTSNIAREVMYATVAVSIL